MISKITPVVPGVVSACAWPGKLPALICGVGARAEVGLLEVTMGKDESQGVLDWEQAITHLFRQFTVYPMNPRRLIKYRIRG